MRSVLFIVGATVLLTGCPPQTVEKLPPVGQFYSPRGMVHLDKPALTGGKESEGVLYVASSDFDKRYDFGSVTALDLDLIGLPPFGDAGFGPPVQILDLKLTNANTALIPPFAGEMAALPMDGGARLFVPTRSEDSLLYALDVSVPRPGEAAAVRCFQPAFTRAPTTSQDGGVRDCTPTGMSLVALEKTDTGIPRAPAPIGVAVSPPPARDVWVTTLNQADSPRGSTLEARGYVVHVNGDNPVVDANSFVNIGSGASYSIVVGQRYAYLTGRIFLAGVPSSLVRAIDTTNLGAFSTFVENSYTAFEGRGVVLSTGDEKRLYALTRSPDSLIIANIGDATGPDPRLRVERSVPLPQSPMLIVAIPRAGKSDLLMISCGDAGTVVFYDDEVGSLTGQIAGVGLQTYALAVDLRASGGARVYVSNSSDGRVTVIDIPDLNRPSSARIVAFLGSSQLCITRGVNEQTSCDGGRR